MQPTERVLIVSQCPVMIAGYRWLFQQTEELTVCGTIDGSASSVDAVAVLRPSLAVIDQSLTTTEQQSLVTALLKQLTGLRILVTSSHADAVMVQRFIALGVQGVISSRASTVDTLEAVRQIARGEVYLTADMKQEIINRAFLNGGEARALDPIEVLSSRELQVFELIGNGKDTREIAELLKISEKTVHAFRSHLRRKLGLTSPAQVATEATRWVEASRDRRRLGQV